MSENSTIKPHGGILVNRIIKTDPTGLFSISITEDLASDVEKSIKRERSSLSHTRYNKMKTLILREVRNAIQEAEYEPTASVADMNLLQSII